MAAEVKRKNLWWKIPLGLIILASMGAGFIGSYNKGTEDRFPTCESKNVTDLLHTTFAQTELAKTLSLTAIGDSKIKQDSYNKASKTRICEATLLTNSGNNLPVIYTLQGTTEGHYALTVQANPDAAPSIAAQPTTNSNPPANSNLTAQPVHEKPVDGYKSFKFGMKPSELAKLQECAAVNYEEAIAKAIADKEKYAASFSANEPGALEANKLLEQLKNDSEGTYAKLLQCNIEVFGENTNPSFVFNENNQLSSINIPLKKADDKLRDVLAQKYSLFSSPAELEISNLNSGQGVVEWLYAHGAVDLRIISMLGQVAIYLDYNDPTTAKKTLTEVQQAAQKGVPNSSDL